MTKLYTRNNLGVWIDRVNQPFQATDTTYLAITDSADPNDNPRQLLGGTLSGTIYMYLFSPPDDTTQVRFYIDGVLHRTENVAIFAWNGDSGGLLNGYSTTVLSNDTHIFSWEADSTSQGTLTGAATVTVSNVSSPTSNVLTMQFASAALNQKLSDAEIAAMFPEALNPDEIQAHNHDEMYIVDGTSGSIGPDYDGSRGRVLATRHRANEHYSGCSVGEPKFSPTPLTNGGGGGYDELILEYDFRYGTQWNFNSKSLGKMPGLSQIVPGGAAGMNNTPGPESPAHCVNQDPGDGSSFRHMVHCESGSSDVLTGQVITYFYTDTKPNNQCGQAAWPLHPNALDGTNLHCGCGSAGSWDGSGYSGSNMFVDGQPVIKRGVWYNLKQHISVSEQFVKTYLDDVLISFISGPPASLLSSGNGTLLNGVRWDMYIGSGPSDPHASGESGCNTRFHQSSDVWWYITNFRVYQPQEPIDPLGIYVTQAELDRWNLRARGLDTRNFHAKGDEWTNSPDDWNRIVKNKNDYDSNPSYYHWMGPTYNWPNAIVNGSSWPNTRPSGWPGFHEQQYANGPIRDAAFWAMVMGSVHLTSTQRQITATVRDNLLSKIKNSVLVMIRSQYLDFTNTQRWDKNQVGSNGWNPTYTFTHWVGRMIMIYDFSQVANPNIWTPAEKTEFIQWSAEFRHWNHGNCWGRRSGNILDNGFPSSSGERPFGGGTLVWHGGPEEMTASHKWDNHGPAQIDCTALSAAIEKVERQRSGITSLTDSDLSDMMSWMKWSIRTFLITEVFASAPGTNGGQGSGGRAGLGQLYRGLSDTSPFDGWKYSCQHTARVLFLADVLLRVWGDDYGYAFSTTDGAGGVNGSVDSRGSIPSDTYFQNPGPKTLHRAAQQIMRFVIESGTNSHPWRFGHKTDSSTSQRIDSVSEPTNSSRYDDLRVGLPYNVYFRDTKIRDIYIRSAANTPSPPANPPSGQTHPYAGTRGIWPGICFMWAYTENELWPYPGTP